MPKISVIVPVYNVEKYIRRCMTSIQQQSLSDIEIVVVNDGTPDDSMAIVRELAQLDDRIKILEHEENMGLMWTRRTGYLAATGDYITFCDSDDYLPQQALDTLYSKAMESGADIVSGNLLYISVKKRERIKTSNLPYGNNPEGVYKALLRQDFEHNLCGRLFLSSLFQNAEYLTYPHATNGEDGCLFYQIIQHIDKAVQIDKPVYYYVQNSNSSSQRRYNENAIKSICQLNHMRVRTVSVYPGLKEDLNRCVTNMLCNLYAQGYHRDAKLRETIHDCGLDAYVSWVNILKYLNYGTFLRIYLGHVVRSYLRHLSR